MLRPYVDQLIYDLLHRIRLHHVPALDAVLRPHPGPQQPQEIVDLRGCADRRAAARRGILLLDRDGWRDAVDPVHQRLRHPLEELFRVGRERFDVTPLALRVERVESERALSRPRRAGDDREGAPRQRDGDPLEIVLARVADDDAVGDARHNPITYKRGEGRGERHATVFEPLPFPLSPSSTPRASFGATWP